MRILFFWVSIKRNNVLSVHSDRCALQVGPVEELWLSYSKSEAEITPDPEPEGESASEGTRQTAQTGIPTIVMQDGDPETPYLSI